MKKIGLVLFFFALMASVQVVMAQSVVGKSNGRIGSIGSDGVIRDCNNAQIGRIEADGTVRDASNVQIGKIEADGTVRNGSNAVIGKIESDGTVRNSSNSVIGKIAPDNASTNSILSASLNGASGINNSWAAVAYFFFLH